jgi:hypothetical protein
VHMLYCMFILALDVNFSSSTSLGVFQYALFLSLSLTCALIWRKVLLKKKREIYDCFFLLLSQFFLSRSLVGQDKKNSSRHLEAQRGEIH